MQLEQIGEENMKKQWVVFRERDGTILCAYSAKAKDILQEELDATKQFLASERGIPIEDVCVTVKPAYE